jgi:hypothetical protein
MALAKTKVTNSDIENKVQLSALLAFFLAGSLERENKVKANIPADVSLSVAMRKSLKFTHKDYKGIY